MKKEPSGTRLYLALFLPLLPADRWLREGGAAGPRAFIEKQRGAMRILALDEAALALGLSPGMMLADARARVPDLAVSPHAPEADAGWRDRIADRCDRYTPMVALDPPDGLILDLTGCTHCWGGEVGLIDDLAAQLARAGWTFRLALAETPDKARALARHGGHCAKGGRTPGSQLACDERSASLPDIRRLSIHALDLDEGRTLALRRAGLYTIGDLARRPRAPLAARIGLDAVARLERILGTDDVRISPRRPQPALFVMRRFAEPVARTGQMLAALADLVAEAAIRLSERGEGGRCFVASLYRSDGDIRSLTIETGAPTRNPDLLMRLFNERIDALSDPLDPGFGYDAVRLAIPVAENLAASQTGFEGDAEDETGIGMLVDRLSIRLGPDRVRRLAAGNTHTPEAAGTSRPAQQQSLATGWIKPEPGEPPLRPLHLFDPPHRIEVVAEAPDGPPACFRWRRETHRVTLSEGPERIAPEWWRRKQGYLPGQEGHTRDYYRVEDESGRRFWLFRNGLYEKGASLLWYIHGIFA